ncbi:MAG: hypothetical protein CMM61_12930 [Rhodospirillaceae bacterium]|nr:hypothetical protein [Rhodospirillaceae bacterium]
MTDRTTDDFSASITQAMPQGPAFPREGAPNRDAVVAAIAEELAIEDALSNKMVRESNPQLADDLLPEWEADYGLPECDHGGTETVSERRAALVEKINRVGSFNPNFLKAMAAKLGFAIEVKERRPARCGISKCGGGHMTAVPKIRYWLTVKVLGPRVTRARCGTSKCSEKLLSITPATDLECRLNAINHSHVKLTFAYEE